MGRGQRGPRRGNQAGRAVTQRHGITPIDLAVNEIGHTPAKILHCRRAETLPQHLLLRQPEGQHRCAVFRAVAVSAHFIAQPATHGRTLDERLPGGAGRRRHDARTDLPIDQPPDVLKDFVAAHAAHDEIADAALLGRHAVGQRFILGNQEEKRQIGQTVQAVAAQALQKRVTVTLAQVERRHHCHDGGIKDQRLPGRFAIAFLAQIVFRTQMFGQRRPGHPRRVDDQYAAFFFHDATPQPAARASRTAIAGKVLPSRNSRKAPPPVEM